MDGEPEPPMGDDLLTNPGHWANADLVVPMVADFLASMSCEEVVRECRERRIPGARVLSIAEVLDEEHYRFNGVITEVGHLDGKLGRDGRGDRARRRSTFRSGRPGSHDAQPHAEMRSPATRPVLTPSAG
jgi:crotonobetainyl-CoA:carnitine CoA-transferase CaiB-like acyl-CoA transferase